MKTLLSTLILGAGLVLGGCRDWKGKKECEEYAKNPKYLCGIVESKGKIESFYSTHKSQYFLLKTNFKTDSPTLVLLNEVSNYTYDIVSEGDTVTFRLRAFQESDKKEYIYPGAYIVKCGLDKDPCITEINSKKPIDCEKWSLCHK